MGRLHKTIKKVIPKEMRTPLDRKIGDENIKTHESLDRRMNPEMPEAQEEKIIPLPDEEELERQRRRKGRGGGRASTVLTSNDEGLGG
jgi:hypothetical protein